MILYSYQATDKDGFNISGQIAAESVSRAVLDLESKGLAVRIIQELQSLSPTDPSEMEQVESNPVESPENSLLYRRIDAALDQRESLTIALQALADDLPRDRNARQLNRLISRISSGCGATELLNDRECAVWVPMVARGMASPVTHRNLCDSLDAVFRENQIRRRRMAAWAYPVAMLLMAFLVVGFLAVLVVPSFRRMFDEMGLRLPPPTELLIWATDQFTTYVARTSILTLVAVTIGLLLWRIWRHWILPTRYFGWIIAGNSGSLSTMASFTNVLAELLSLDATLPEALRLASRNCASPFLAQHAQLMASELQSQHLLASETRSARLFPPTLVFALTAGSDQRPNVNLLRELATLYADRVRMRIDWASSMVGPVAVLGIGALVMFIVLALFMPLVSMISSLS